MPVVNILRDFRQRYDLSQEAVGEVTYCNQKLISQFERGERLPGPSFFNDLVRAIPFAISVKAQAGFEQRSEFVSVPLLNNVDNHIMSTLYATRSEFTESLEALESLMSICLNKSSKKVILQDDQIKIKKHLDQIVDIYTACKKLLCDMSICFGISVDELVDRHISKLIEREYYSPNLKFF